MVAVGLVLCGALPWGWAQTVYVSDVIRISVRSGPGNEHKAVTVVESGQQLEMLKPGEEWSQVRTGNGTDGYMLSRFLTPEQPMRFRFEQIQEKHKALTAQAAGLVEENNRLKAERDQSAAVLERHKKQTDSLREEFEAFKREAADVTALKARNEALTAELEQEKRALQALENQPLDLLQLPYIYWFLAGAGVLLLGFLIGFSVKRQRRWSSLG
jgi:SH3 domain protein